MRPQKYTLKLVNNRMLTRTVFELQLEANDELDFEAGQFISLVVPGAGPKGKDARRAYSIASPPKTRPIELCIKYVEDGAATRYLSNLKPGDELTAYAPYGRFIYRTTPDRNVCFIATGTGVAPFRAMVASERYQQHPPRLAHCLYGARHDTEILYEEELAHTPGVKWIPMISRPSETWTGRQGRVTEYLKEHPEEFDWANTDFYLCGNGAMIQEVKQFLKEEKGVEKRAIMQEVYYKPKNPSDDDEA